MPLGHNKVSDTYRITAEIVTRHGPLSSAASGVSGRAAAMALLQAVQPGILKALHEMPSTSSDWTARQPHARWVARMTKRPAPPGAGKGASLKWRPE